jgi:hypothetical protein
MYSHFVVEKRWASSTTNPAEDTFDVQSTTATSTTNATVAASGETSGLKSRRVLREAAVIAPVFVFMSQHSASSEVDLTSNELEPNVELSASAAPKLTLTLEPVTTAS